MFSEADPDAEKLVFDRGGGWWALGGGHRPPPGAQHPPPAASKRWAPGTHPYKWKKLPLEKSIQFVEPIFECSNVNFQCLMFLLPILNFGYVVRPLLLILL